MTGALLEIEAFSHTKQLRDMLASLIKALNG
jgi:hypothetical protein